MILKPVFEEPVFYMGIDVGRALDQLIGLGKPLGLERRLDQGEVLGSVYKLRHQGRVLPQSFWLGETNDEQLASNRFHAKAQDHIHFKPKSFLYYHGTVHHGLGQLRAFTDLGGHFQKQGIPVYTMMNDRYDPILKIVGLTPEPNQCVVVLENAKFLTRPPIGEG